MVQSLPKFASVNTFSTTDFPDKISAVFFTQGCPLRCPWCHNPELWEFPCSSLERDSPSSLKVDQLHQFLNNRRGLIDAIVVSGGEPLYQSHLLQFFKCIQEYGYLSGIHTTGIRPDTLIELSPYLDWIGLDCKTLPHLYSDLTGHPQAWEKLDQCLKELIPIHPHVEVRTSTSPEYLSCSQIQELMYLMSQYGVKQYALQELRPTFKEDAQPLRYGSYTPEEQFKLQNLGHSLFEKFTWRQQ